MIAVAAKKKIDFVDYLNDVVKALSHGLLLTTKAKDKVNSMVIGWGTPGINWSKPVFAVYVREGRFTREQLDANPEFTVNVPMGTFNRKIIAVCGGKSGRNIDKVKEAGLTLVEPDVIFVPGIKEFPLTFECRVMYRQIQNLSGLADKELKEKLYPQNIDGTEVGANRDPHVSYFGEIVSSYIIED